MAQIPGLPTVEPVSRPMAKPQQFGAVGDTIAGLGAETEQMAASAADFEGQLAHANRNLKAAQAEIAIERVKKQTSLDLSKASSPEEAQAIYLHSREQIAGALAPYQNDRSLSRALGLAQQQADVDIQATTNATKAKIISESSKIALAEIGKDSLQEAINLNAAGANISAAREPFRLKLQSFVDSKAIWPQEADAIMRKWDTDYQKGAILTKIQSPSKAIRDDVIKQLSEGGGTLDHSMLNKEEINQLYVHAVDTDHNLTQKEEAGSLNGALNIKAEWFSSPEFKNADGTPNYEAREKALQDGNQLIAHGIVTPDGKPNRVMADKLMEDDARQWNMNQKVQRDKDEAVLEKYSPMIYDPRHPLTIAQIENLPQTDGASSRAVNQLKTALFQEQRQARVMRNEERSLGLAERQQKRRELEDRSTATSLQLTDRMADGDVLDYNRDILEPISKGEMTESDGAKVWRLYKSSDQYPQIGEGIGIIKSAFSGMTSNPENNRKAADARDSFLKSVKEKNLHGGDILKEAQSIADSIGKTHVTSWIDKWFGGFGKQLGYGSESTPTSEQPKTEAPPDTQTFTDGGKTYHIPANMVDDFKRDHPNAR